MRRVGGKDVAVAARLDRVSPTSSELFRCLKSLTAYLLHSLRTLMMMRFEEATLRT